MIASNVCCHELVNIENFSAFSKLFRCWCQNSANLICELFKKDIRSFRKNDNYNNSSSNNNSWMQLILLPKIGSSFDIWNRFNISSRASLYPLINFCVDELLFLHNQNWPNSINWLCLFSRLFSKMYCLFDTEAFYDVMKFEYSKILNFEFLENKNSFWSDIRHFS